MCLLQVSSIVQKCKTCRCTPVCASFHLSLMIKIPLLFCASHGEFVFVCVPLLSPSQQSESGPTHTHVHKCHKHAETNYLWNLWNNRGSRPQLSKLCIICLTPPSSALLFYLSNCRKNSGGPDSFVAGDEANHEPVERLWEDIFKKTSKFRRE